MGTPEVSKPASSRSQPRLDSGTAGQTSTASAVATPTQRRNPHPSWWGHAGTGYEPERPTYEDLGEEYPRPEERLVASGTLQRGAGARSLPMLASSRNYEHRNPLTAHFVR